MAKLEESTRRLNVALQKLERALDARQGPGADQSGDSALRRELEEARAEKRRLEKLNDEVANRLDDAIEELRKVLKD